jgi:hypothetical protein
MAKKSAAKKKTVEEVVEEVKDEGIEVEVVVEEPKEETMAKESKPKKEEGFKRLVSANGRDFYVDADGNEIKED